MSMRVLAPVTDNMDEDEIEAEIQRELDALSLDDAGDEQAEEVQDTREDTAADNLQDTEDMPKSMMAYIERMRANASRLEEELTQCDELLRENELALSTPRQDDVILKLAQEAGEDPFHLKQKVLAELEREDEEEEKLLSGNNQGEKGKKTSEPPGEQNEQISQEEPQENKENGFTLKPGEGVIMEMFESDILEQQVRQQVQELELRQKQKEEQRKQEEDTWKSTEVKAEHVITQKRNEKRRQIEEEKHIMLQQQQKAESRLQEEAEDLQKKIEQSLTKYQEEIEELDKKTREELGQLQQSRKEKQLKEEKDREKAAVKIQAMYRAHRVRKEFGSEVNEKIQNVRENRIKDRILEIEKERAEIKSKEENKKIEEERLKQKVLEAEQRQKEKEEEKMRDEEIKRQQEERERLQREKEKKRIAEEKQKKEEQRKREEDEKKRRQEEERERLQKEEEIRRMAEEKQKEEQRQREEDEKKTRQEEERLQKEQEDKRQAEEKRKREQRLQEEEKKKEKELAKRKELERKAEEEKTKMENEQKKKLTRQNDGQKINATEPMADLSMRLPDHIEGLRLSWIKQCKPYSKIQSAWRSKKPSSGRKPPRRPISAKRQPELTHQQILSATKATSLQKVTTVELHDLPGFSVKTLAECSQLRHLVVNKCHLVAVEGLEGHKCLQYADFKYNTIEMMSMKDVTSLTYLDMTHNNLTSIHGLDGCHNLRHLSVAHNRITRIGGLESLKSLHTLDASYNQLITTKGLSEAPSIQEVDVSHNHLPGLDDLESLALLQVIKATGNNIMQLPIMSNQVLLRELVLDDNSLSSVDVLSNTWLPMLHKLVLAQNGLLSLGDISTCVLLNTLDLSHNQILELESLLPGLEGCRNLEHLLLEGNPVAEESSHRSSLSQGVPCLQTVDGVMVEKAAQSSPARTTFEIMCMEELQHQKQLQQDYFSALKSCSKQENRCAIQTQYYDQSNKLAVEHRYTHEYGETSAKPKHKPPISFTKPQETPRTDKKAASVTQASQMKNKFEEALQKAQGGSEVLDGSEAESPWKHKMASSVTASTIGKKLQEDELRKEKAVTTLQAYWRGHTVRREIELRTEEILAQTDQQEYKISPAKQTGFAENRKPPINSEEIGKQRNHENELFDEVLMRKRKQQIELWDISATKIQALWRGYILRRRLQYALEYAKFDDGEDEEEDEFLEVNLDDFNFDVDGIDKDWAPSATPQLPASHAVIGKSSSVCDGKPPVPPLFNKVPHPPDLPKQAWRGTDSPFSDTANFPANKPPLPPLSRMSDRSETTHQTMDTHRTAVSKRSEKISEEWGFKDSRTADLMLQRAKKLKYNAQKKKKLSQLDPKQRLKLFKKLEETTKLRPVQPPQRKGLQRKDYFQAREEEGQREAYEKLEEKTSKVQRTFEWLHTQVGQHDVTTSRINNGGGGGSSLPQMDAGVLAGGRHSLTGSPISMELQSVESASTYHSEGYRRHSSSAQDSGGSKIQLFPPIKGGSAPSIQSKPERMSFRNKPTQQSVGWGGGKKRSTKR